MSIINDRERDDQLFAKIGGKACAEPLMKRTCELPGSHWVQSIAEHDATDYLVNLELPERISRDSSSFQQLYGITADLANLCLPTAVVLLRTAKSLRSARNRCWTSVPS